MPVTKTNHGILRSGGELPGYETRKRPRNPRSYDLTQDLALSNRQMADEHQFIALLIVKRSFLECELAKFFMDKIHKM